MTLHYRRVLWTTVLPKDPEGIMLPQSKFTISHSHTAWLPDWLTCILFFLFIQFFYYFNGSCILIYFMTFFCAIVLLQYSHLPYFLPHIPPSCPPYVLPVLIYFPFFMFLLLPLFLLFTSQPPVWIDKGEVRLQSAFTLFSFYHKQNHFEVKKERITEKDVLLLLKKTEKKNNLILSHSSP